MDGGGRRSPRFVAAGKESERVQKRNSRSVSPPPPAQTGVKVRPRREPVRSGKGASQGTVVGPGLAKTDRDRAAGVEEELVDLPAWSAEGEDKEETAAGTAAAPEPELSAGVPLRAIQQHGLWGAKSETATRSYIDRSYPIQPYTALVFDFLLDVGQAAVIMAE